MGLSASEARLFDVEGHRPDGLDIGSVGQVTDVRPDLLLHLTSAGYVPVVFSVVSHALLNGLLSDQPTGTCLHSAVDDDARALEGAAA